MGGWTASTPRAERSPSPWPRNLRPTFGGTMVQVRGMLSASELEERARSGDIDTILVVFPDLQGRLVGKRVTGHFWCEEMKAGAGDIHACNYLIAVDSEMTVLPGYRFANWDKGYGDFALRPDLATIREIPWLERTALVLCDLFDEETGEPIEVSPAASCNGRWSGPPRWATR